MNGNPRITLNMGMFEIVAALSENNPGAVSALVDCMKCVVTVDPDSGFRELTPLLDLDTLGIYGPSIWVLYNDNCQRSAYKMLVLLRAWQLGFLPESELHGYANERSDSITDGRFEFLEKQVRERLPNFART